MEFLSALRHIVVGGLDFRIFEQLVLPARHINFHKVLINDPSGTEVQMSHLRISHLSLRKSHSLAAGLKMRMWIFRAERIDIWCALSVDCVCPVMLALAPTVEDHKKYFFTHIVLFFCRFE